MTRRNEPPCDDIRWNNIHQYLNSDAFGYLPDVTITDTSEADWGSLLALIAASTWDSEFIHGSSADSWPTATEFLDTSDDLTREVRVHPSPDILVIVRPFAPSWIEFDLDGREILDQARLDVVCDFVAAVGRHLVKPTVLTLELAAGLPVFGYEPRADRVVRYVTAAPQLD
ncbi:hypothetical protein ACTWPB_27050 [Nocardia sp. IBHARD005]|uniref:hypothetical protein n=1 Tax=Nocardia sp. IBHARD005 TaxID=3457765 RepID=UPI004059B36F